MDNNKKDWTAEERARFERIFCAFIAAGEDWGPDTKSYLEHTEKTINLLDQHYKNTSHEPTTNTNN